MRFWVVIAGFLLLEGLFLLFSFQKESDWYELQQETIEKYGAFVPYFEGDPLEVQEIIIANKSVTKIPDDITRFKNLRRLELINTGLKEINPKICQLEYLRYLNLSNNQITEIPNEIGSKLKHIETINLSHNQLKSLPNSFNYSGHSIDYISRNLMSLNIAYNQLGKDNGGYVFDNERALNFPWLDDLNLAHNQLKHLSFRNTRVNTLNLSNNQFKTLHRSIFECPLHDLDLSNNQLKEFPKIVSDYAYLEQINLSNNEFIEIPNYLSTQPLLENINLHNNKIQLTQVPHLECLTLNLSFNKIKKIPASIQNLRQVSNLDLSHNYIENIHPNIGHLLYLNRLTLTNNQFSNPEYRKRYGDPISKDQQKALKKLLYDTKISF